MKPGKQLRMPITLISPLSLGECQRRIAEGVDPLSWFENWQGTKSILGRVDGTTLRLEARQKGRNSFAPIFVGALSSDADKTILRGRFRMPLSILIFLGVMVGGLLLATLFTKQLIALCILLPLAALVTFGYVLGKDDERAIRQFLQTTLETKAAE